MSFKYSAATSVTLLAETCLRSRNIRKAHHCSTTSASIFPRRTTVKFPLRNKQKLLYMRFRFVLSKHKHSISPFKCCWLLSVTIFFCINVFLFGLCYSRCFVVFGLCYIYTSTPRIECEGKSTHGTVKVR